MAQANPLLLVVAIVSAMCILPPSVHASVRTSTDYTITAETLDAGGAAVASADYTVDTSVTDSPAGLSSVNAPDVHAKFGFIGQLYDLSGLSVAASPATVDENASRQLNAAAALDDDSLLALASSDPTWSILGGPLVSISASGVAQAGYVYQDTPATVGGEYQSKTANLSLTVLNVGDDDMPNGTGDGLPDTWQAQYFGGQDFPLNPDSIPTADPDGDGQDNLFEFVAGSIPVNSVSRFDLRIEAVSGQPTQKNLVFSPRLADRNYTPQFLTVITQDNWAPLADVSTADNGNERTITDLNASGPQRFYRIQISLP